MNCIECQDNLVANLEGVLAPQEAAAFQKHLAGCPACQSEQTKVVELHQRLITHGEFAAHVALGPTVMGRIRREAEAPSTMSAFSRWLRWVLGCGAATTVIVLAVVLVSPRTTANATEVMARGVKAAMSLTSVHLQARLRSSPAENFVNIDPQSGFTTVELWKEREGQGRWRIEKPGRVVVMDGQSTVHLLRPLKAAMQLPAVAAMRLPTAAAVTVAGEEFPERWAPFDTGWLHAIADLEQTLETELRRAQAKGWPMAVTREVAGSGAAQVVVTIEVASGLPQGDYLQNKSFDTANTRRVYRFDDATGRLQGMAVHLREEGGDVLIFEVTRITYNEVFGPEVFRLNLPPDVVIQGAKTQLTGDDAIYAGLTAEQAARRFFEACGRDDWTEVSAFSPLPMDDRLKGLLSGLKIVGLGESFTSAAYLGRFVPYEIQLKDGHVWKNNLALKQDGKRGRWHVDGGL